MAQRVNINLPHYPEVEIRVTGNWTRVENLTANLSTSVQIGYDKGIASVSKRILNIVKRSIRSSTPPPGSGVQWQPHSPHTVRQYGHHGIYNLYGVYLRALKVQRYKNRTYVGIPKGYRPSNQKSKLTLNEIAILLEFGGNNGNLPARPLWAPSYKSFGGDKKTREEIIRNIRSQLFRDFGINARRVR